MNPRKKISVILESSKGKKAGRGMGLSWKLWCEYPLILGLESCTSSWKRYKSALEKESDLRKMSSTDTPTGSGECQIMRSPFPAGSEIPGRVELYSGYSERWS